MELLSKEDIIKAYPYFEVTEMGRLKCTLTGHESVDEAKQLKEYINTKKFKRALSLKKVQQEFGQYIGQIEDSPRFYCKVTKRDIEVDGGSLRRHFEGKRFLTALPGYLEKLEKGEESDDDSDESDMEDEEDEAIEMLEDSESEKEAEPVKKVTKGKQGDKAIKSSIKEMKKAEAVKAVVAVKGKPDKKKISPPVIEANKTPKEGVKGKNNKKNGTAKPQVAETKKAVATKEVKGKTAEIVPTPAAEVVSARQTRANKKQAAKEEEKPIKIVKKMSKLDLVMEDIADSDSEPIVKKSIGSKRKIALNGVKSNKKTKTA
uniref:Surfeit locus protein 2 n=1 Tax=Rhabditophanes sp. KR3021 TaxID=114890 RepID=A0AC35UGB9_9BILA